MIIKCMWLAYDVAHYLTNMRAYALMGYSAGVALRQGVDTVVALLS